MKYIIVNRDGIEVAILFPEIIQHVTAINQLALRPISAGFCKMRDGQVECYGESDSLKLKSRPQDADAVQTSLLLMGLLSPVADEVTSRPQFAAA